VYARDFSPEFFERIVGRHDCQFDIAGQLPWSLCDSSWAHKSPIFVRWHFPASCDGKARRIKRLNPPDPALARNEIFPERLRPDANR